MKIKVKDNYAQSKVPGILFISFFGIASTGIIIGSSEKFNGNYKLNNISEIVGELGIVSLFATIFLCVSLFLLLYLLKSPKRCTANVLSIDNNVEDDLKTLEILVKDGAREVVCVCQTALSNNIDMTKKYVAYVKEFNWEIKFLEELNQEKFEEIDIRTKKLKIMTAACMMLVITRIIIFGG